MNCGRAASPMTGIVSVIRSHLYDYPLAPEPLVVSSEEANKEEDLLE